MDKPTSDQPCPVCKGKGRLRKPKLQPKRVANNAIMAKLLHEAGYSLREISKFLGYRSSRSAALLIQRKP